MFYIESIKNNNLYVRDTSDNILESYTEDSLYSIVINYKVKIEGFYGHSITPVKCFQLMNKNNLIGEFTINPDLYYSFYKLTDSLPLDFTDINSWIKSRKIFTCAKDIESFFATLGISSDIDFIELFNCTSLHDTFWVRPYSSNKLWKEVSPYHNDYSKYVSFYSLEGIIGNKDFKYVSPDVATDGSFPSTWRFRGINSIEYYKAGSKFTLPAFNSGFEPYSEYYACVVSKYLGFRCVDYKLKNYRHREGKEEIITVCPSYTNSEVGSISATRLELHSYEAVLDYCEKLSDSALNTCLDMFFLDCLLLNTDRHFGNIEFLFDTDTLQIFDISPIYDNNNSLLPRFMPKYDKFNRSDYTARDGRTFEELYTLICKYKNFDNLLHKLKGLTFKQVVGYPDDKLKFINVLLKKQIDYLLSLKRC